MYHQAASNCSFQTATAQCSSSFSAGVGSAFIGCSSDGTYHNEDVWLGPQFLLFPDFSEIKTEGLKLDFPGLAVVRHDPQLYRASGGGLKLWPSAVAGPSLGRPVMRPGRSMSRQTRRYPWRPLKAASRLAALQQAEAQQLARIEVKLAV